MIIEVKSDKILEDYLYEWLLNEEYLIRQLTTPALIPNLDEKKFLNLEIRIPEVKRQYEVVNILKGYRRILIEKEEETIKLIGSLKAAKLGLLNEFIEKIES